MFIILTVNLDYSVTSSSLVFDSDESQMDFAVQILTNYVTLLHENATTFLVTLISNDTYSDSPTATIVILDTCEL